MICCTADVRLITLSTYTIHWNPANSRVINITLISPGILLIISFSILLDLNHKLHNSLGQMLAVWINCMQHLLLMLKFDLLLSAHIMLMLELYFQCMDALQH